MDDWPILSLIVFLRLDFSVFRAVSLTLGLALVLASLHPSTRLGPTAIRRVLIKASQSGVALIAAAASVGIVIGVVTLTGLGSRMPALLLQRRPKKFASKRKIWPLIFWK